MKTLPDPELEILGKEILGQYHIAVIDAGYEKGEAYVVEDIYNLRQKGEGWVYVFSKRIKSFSEPHWSLEDFNYCETCEYYGRKWKQVRDPVILLEKD